MGRRYAKNAMNVKPLHVTENLRSYITDVLSKGEWNVKEFNDITLAYIDTCYDQVFNYIFYNKRKTLVGLSQDEINLIYDMRPNRQDIEDTLNYCNEHGIDVAIPLDAHMTDTIEYVKHKNATLVSDPWKVYLPLRSASCDSKAYGFEEEKDFELVPVNVMKVLEEYDYVVSTVFNNRHNDIAVRLLRSLVGKEFDKAQRTQFFIAKYRGTTVGACGFHMDHDNCAGFYSDSIFPQYRKRNFGKHLILHRIRKAKEFDCPISIAQCISNQGEGSYISMGYKKYGKLYNYFFNYSHAS